MISCASCSVRRSCAIYWTQARVEDVEAQLRGNPRNADQLHDQLRLRGDLREGEYDEGFAQTLLRERRALLVRFADEQRLIAAEDAGRYRDALGVMPPGGLPEVFLEGAHDALDQLVARYARGRGPFTTAQANERFGRDVEPLLQQLERQEKLVRGELRPGGTEREWCDPDVLRRLRRASLAALRKEVEPAEQAAFGRFLPHWHGIDRRATLREALVPLQGLSLPVALWESDVLPRRVPGFNPGQLDQLCASGEVVWVGAGLDRVAVFFREDAPALGRPAAAARPEGEAHDKIREALGRSAEFWYDLVTSTGLEAEVALPALWDLVWAGEVTNDAWTPLRAGRRYQSPKATRAWPAAPLLAPAFSRDHRDAGTLVAHRQALPRPARRARPRRTVARTSRNRHARRCPRRRDPRWVRRGVRRASCARDTRRLPAWLLRRGPRRRPVRRPGRGGATSGVASARGRGAGTARPSRRGSRHSPTARACPGRSERERARRVSPGAQVVLLGGQPALFVERGGKSLVPLRDPEDDWLRVALKALVEHVKKGGSKKRLAVERFDGEPVGETEIMPLLLEAGFLAGPRRAVLRP